MYHSSVRVEKTHLEKRKKKKVNGEHCTRSVHTGALKFDQMRILEKWHAIRCTKCDSIRGNDTNFKDETQ